MNKYSRYRDGIDGGIFDDGRIRIFLLGIVFFTAFTALALRLYYLQLHKGEEHRRRIAGQSIRYVRNPGRRGEIYTADGVLLAGNRTANDLVFYPSEMRRNRGRKPVSEYMAQHAIALGRAINRQDYPDLQAIRNHLYRYPGIPMLIFRDLTPQETARAFEALRTIPGADIQQSYIRICPEKSCAAGIIGFARNADPSTADDREKFKYYIPDLEGRSGVEKFCDLNPGGGNYLGLRALPGHSIIQVNSLGYAHRELLGKSEPLHGNNVYLTIDFRAQKLAEKLLSGYTGAMVVIDADNGDIICAASQPGVDLSRFYPVLSKAYAEELKNNPASPQVFRAFNAIYPPGSTLKPLISLAFLKHGIDPKEQYPCEGSIPIGNTSIRCSAHRYAGADVDMELALKKSCNSYMIHHALTTGMEPLTAMLRNAGIGRKTGLEIPDAKGDFPDKELKKRRFKAKWNSFDTALLSIGQGFVSASPLQLALIAGAFANGGKIYQPHLVNQIVDAGGVAVYTRKIRTVSDLDVTPQQLQTVKNGMFQVVNSPGGSGKNARVEGLDIYGKTGTAEVGYGANKRNITHFIAFVTCENRRYAACVTVEDGQSGGRTCAPLAAAFFEHYLMNPPAEN